MQHEKSLKMGVMPIPKLLATMSLPAIFSMMVQALYNIVDTIFVAKISGAATTALSLAFPMQMLTMAFAFGIGIGSNSVISRRLGEDKVEEAHITAKHGMMMSLITSAFFAVFGYFIAKLFITLYVNSGEYIDADLVLTYGVQYLAIVTAVSFGMHIEIFGTKALQATGNMLVPMVSQLIGAIVNIILDPIMIFGLLGFPRLEVAGAAIATVIGQICAMTFTLIMLRRNKKQIDVSLKGFRPQKKYVSEILKVGIPVTIMNSVASITTASLNAILNSINTIGIAVLGIYFKLQSFVFMPVFGLCQGALPIMGYNYGARNKKRFKQVFVLATGVALGIMLVGLLIFQLLPSQLFLLFKAENNEVFYNELVVLGVYAFRVISIAFIPAAISIIMINMFQAIGKGVTSMIISLFRQIVILLPISFILGKLVGVNGVWWGYPIAEILTAVIFLPIAIKTINNAFNPLTAAEFAPIEQPFEDTACNNSKPCDSDANILPDDRNDTPPDQQNV